MPRGESRLRGHRQLVRFRAADGFLINALLMTRDAETTAGLDDYPVLLQIHGSLGHFLARGTPRQLPSALLDRGVGSLSINTRLAGAGQITGQGVFPDTRKDIEAAVEFLAEEGFRRIFVLGYSLGASMVVHWAAQTPHPNVRGLVLEGCGYSLPDSHRKRSQRYGASPSYEDVHARARDVLGDDPYHSTTDETFVAYRSTGPTREPHDSEVCTYKTWWFMYGPEAREAMAHRYIARIALPMVIMRGEWDGLVEDWEPDALGALARDAGNERVRVVRIANSGHDCMENAEAMLEEITRLIWE
jgi:pimeloyl-ACP methyl ester carboxylesterase